MKNESLKILLLDDQVRVIAVTYEKIDYNADTTKMRQFSPAYLSSGKLPEGAMLFKTTDPDIKVGTFVIVPTNTRHGMTVCKVVGVDVDVDFDSSTEVYWVVDKVDTAPFEQIRQDEERVLLSMKAVSDRKRREEARASFMEGMPDDVNQLKLGGPVIDQPVDDKAT